MNFENFDLDEAIQDQEFLWVIKNKQYDKEREIEKEQLTLKSFSSSEQIYVEKNISNETHSKDPISWSILNAKHLNDLSLNNIQTVLNLILEKRLNNYKVDHLAGFFEKVLVDNRESIIFKLKDDTGSIEIIVNWDALNFFNSFFQPGSSFLFKQVSILNLYPGSKLYAVVTKRNVVVAISSDGQIWPKDAVITFSNDENKKELSKILSPSKKFETNTLPLDDTDLCFDFDNFNNSRLPSITDPKSQKSTNFNTILEEPKNSISQQEPLASSFDIQASEDNSKLNFNDKVLEEPSLSIEKLVNDPINSASNSKFTSKIKERMLKFKFSETLPSDENELTSLPRKKIVKQGENKMGFEHEDEINFELDDLVKVHLPTSHNSAQNCNTSLPNRYDNNLFDEDQELDSLMCSLPHNLH